MATYVYGPWVSSLWRSMVAYDVSTTNTQVTVIVREGNSSYNASTDTFTHTGTWLPDTKYGSYWETGYADDSVSLSIGGTTVYSGAMSGATSQDYSKTFTRTHSNQTINVIGSNTTPSNGTRYWNASGSKVTAPGTSTATASITIPAKPSYSVSYNANNGSGAPSAQTKWYGETLTLSTTKPTRQYHKFDGWATSANGAAAYCTGTNNTSNTSYTANAAVTLYAHWTRVHQPPTISSFTVIRCKENGTPDDEGTYCKAKVTWSVDTAVYSSNVGSTLSIAVSGVEGTESVNLSGTGTTTEVVYDVAVLGTDSTYTVTATVTDSKSTSTSRNAILSMAFFTMDFKEGGHGIGIGKPANDEVNDLLDIAMKTRFNALATVQATTESSVAYDSGNPKIRFSNENASQNGDLVFTDYDAVHPGATLAWITDQPQSWFYTQHIKATGSITSGGTIMAGQSENITSTVINDASVATSSNTGITNRLDYAGNGTQVGYSQIIRTSSGMYRSFAVTNPKTSKTTSIYLFANDNGTQSISFTSGVALDAANGGTGRAMTTANRTYWCGRIIYDNNSGSSGNIKVSETFANFAFVLIGFKENDGYYDGMFVGSPNGKTVILHTTESTVNGANNSKWQTRTLSGTACNVSHYSDNNTTANHIYITHIIGFA